MTVTVFLWRHFFMCSNQMLFLRKAVGPLTFRPNIPLNVNTSETEHKIPFLFLSFSWKKFCTFRQKKRWGSAAFLFKSLPVSYKKETKNNLLPIEWLCFYEYFLSSGINFAKIPLKQQISCKWNVHQKYLCEVSFSIYIPERCGFVWLENGQCWNL